MLNEKCKMEFTRGLNIKKVRICLAKEIVDTTVFGKDVRLLLRNVIFLFFSDVFIYEV
jgi:hypothetical protein